MQFYPWWGTILVMLMVVPVCNPVLHYNLLSWAAGRWSSGLGQPLRFKNGNRRPPEETVNYQTTRLPQRVHILGQYFFLVQAVFSLALPVYLL